MGLGDRIRKAIDDSGISQAEVARRLGVTPQAVNGWITTDTISKKNLVRLAGETGADLQALMEERTEIAAAAAEADAEYVARPMFARTRATIAPGVPIVGMAVANPTEDGYFDDQQYPVGAGEGYIAWPTKDRDAYAREIKGDSMAPRVRHGEYVVVEPNSPLTPGDDVIVCTKKGRTMLKRLLYQRQNEVALGSINERHPTITLSLEEIELIHFVGGIAPRSSKVEP